MLQWLHGHFEETAKRISVSFDWKLEFLKSLAKSLEKSLEKSSVNKRRFSNKKLTIRITALDSNGVTECLESVHCPADNLIGRSLSARPSD